jgi:excisionase family DNA binding protein
VNTSAESTEEVDRAHSEDIAESSGYTSTKQAAKVLGVSRRTVQAYVRRGELEAVVEGEGVEKTFYVSIDSLDAMRERRRLADEGSSRSAGFAPGDSANSSLTAKATQSADITGEPAQNRSSELIDIVQDLQYRLGRAEAQVELTAQTESTLHEQLAREQARADRLEAELLESRRLQPETRDEPLEGAEPRPGTETPASDTGQPRPSWWRRFFGFE